MMDISHMAIVPSDRDRVPAFFGDRAAISGITSPVNTSALLEVLRFGGSHIAPRLSESTASLSISDVSRDAVASRSHTDWLACRRRLGRIRRRSVQMSLDRF